MYLMPPNRPQEPKPPFCYQEETVTYKNTKDNINISGTLTFPHEKGPFATIILVPGMGPNDRNCTMLGHKPFLLLADFLTRYGYCVLRFDKRGIGKSNGTYSTAITSAQFANDVEAGIAYLKTRPDLIDQKQISLLGHSEGGMIAAIVTAQCPDVSALILLANVAFTSPKKACEQIGLLLRAHHASQECIDADFHIRKQLLEIVHTTENRSLAAQKMHIAFTNHWNNLPRHIRKELNHYQFDFAINAPNKHKVMHLFNSSWYRFFLHYDPLVTLEKITIPVLVLGGENDFIVSPQLTFPIIEKALQKAKNPHYTMLTMPHINHWFQTCKTGILAEYATIEETISPIVLETIVTWLKKQTHNK